MENRNFLETVKENGDKMFGGGWFALLSDKDHEKLYNLFEMVSKGLIKTHDATMIFIFDWLETRKKFGQTANC